MQYLKEMKHDQYSVSALADDGEVSDGQLIAFAKLAFLTSGHKKAVIMNVNVKWAKWVVTGKASNPAFLATMLQDFCLMYNRETEGTIR